MRRLLCRRFSDDALRAAATRGDAESQFKLGLRLMQPRSRDSGAALSAVSAMGLSASADEARALICEIEAMKKNARKEYTRRRRELIAERRASGASIAESVAQTRAAEDAAAEDAASAIRAFLDDFFAALVFLGGAFAFPDGAFGFAAKYASKRDCVAKSFCVRTGGGT